MCLHIYIYKCIPSNCVVLSSVESKRHSVMIKPFFTFHTHTVFYFLHVLFISSEGWSGSVYMVFLLVGASVRVYSYF